MKLAITTTALVASALAITPHPERVLQVEELNKRPGMLWTAGLNPRFAHLPPGAARSLCGVKNESLSILQSKAVRAPAGATVELPTSFDSESNWPECADVIGDIRDQSNCGCCWAFGAASAASDRLCIATKGAMKFPLSAQDTCFCASSDGCNGGDLFTPWSYIQSTGLTTGSQFNNTGFGGNMGLCSQFSLPHCHHHGPQGSDPYPAEGQPGCPSASSPQCPTKCDDTARFPHNKFAADKYTFSGLVTTYPDPDSIAQAIMEQGPVEAAFLVYGDFENYVGGIYHKTSDEVLGGHAIRIVGWGEESGTKYWKIANSWNPFWGEKGYFRIVRGTNECDIEKQVTANSADATWKKM